MIIRWITSSLSRKLLFVLVLSLCGTSILFLVLFVGLYRSQLEQERADASAKTNLLLQFALENAMLKRDLPGLREIVRRFGQQKGMVNVMIINTAREIRFASKAELLGRRLKAVEIGICADCGKGTPMTATTRFMTDMFGKDVLRSINPVRNKGPCQTCHGSIAKTPINGIILVDYAAGALRRNALLSAFALSVSGAVVMIIALFGTWFFLRRAVVRPVGRLTEFSRAFANGRLDARAPVRGQDEVALLGQTYNRMAEKLGATLHEMRDKERFIQATIDAVPDGIRVIDENFVIVKANQAYCRQLQQEMHETVGSHCYTSSHGREQPCAPTLVTCPLHELSSGSTPLKCMHRHVRQDGASLHVEVFAAPLRMMANGETSFCVVEAIRDISQQTKHSQEQRLAELGHLATGVAHEVHNPLASARLGLQAILRGLNRDDIKLPEVLAYLSTVDGEIDKCVEVTARLLKLSAPPSDHLQLVSLSEIIPDVTSLLTYEADRTGIRVGIDLGSKDLRVLATDSEVRQLVLNLVQNAFHAMPNGGDLQIRGRVKGASVEVVFGDSGVGIAPAHMPHIFDPFFSHRADGILGTGLGLTLCKAIVERYDGSIDVDSEVGKGTMFVLKLPFADKAEALQ